MARLLVTIGTDGATNWVKTPDGQRFNLGSVTILSFVTKLALGGNREAKRALNGFLQGEEVMLRVDDSRMWEMFAPRRIRWAADSFIPQDQRGTGNVMATIDTHLDALEQHIQVMNKAAGKVSSKKMAEGVNILVKLAGGIKLSEQDADEGQEPEEKPAEAQEKTAASVDDLNIDAYQANSKLATQILNHMEAVDQKIDQLVTAGKKFNASRAKADIHAVTSKVAAIVSDIDLTTPWVMDDLQKLASRAGHIHGLFFPKK
jgi:hypothetical protein